MRFGTPEFYLKTRLEMEQLFDGDKAPLDRTWEIAQMCNLELKKLQIHFRSLPYLRTARSTSISSKWLLKGSRSACHV